jgi:hypothetical protein
MKKGRERSAEAAKKRTDARARKETAKRAEELRRRVLVNVMLLRPTNSYGIPDFVERGYYVDRPFVCKDCGKSEVWTATQQKWWYETAKGDVWTIAVRCRPCRRREQARKAEARRVHFKGVGRE